jgi:DNA-binding CsgD family transcriptional regulator
MRTQATCACGLPLRLQQALAALLEGESEKDVAQRLALSPATAHQYIKQLYRYFGLQSRAQLMSQMLLRRAPQPWDTLIAEASPSPLSPRLKQTLACLLEGDSEKQIAARLGLSRATLHQYVTALYRQLDVQSRPQLFARMLERARALHASAGTPSCLEEWCCFGCMPMLSSAPMQRIEQCAGLHEQKPAWASAHPTKGSIMDLSAAISEFNRANANPITLVSTRVGGVVVDLPRVHRRVRVADSPLSGSAKTRASDLAALAEEARLAAAAALGLLEAASKALVELALPEETDTR